VNGRGLLAKLLFPVIIIALLVRLAASSLGTGTDDTKRKYLFSQMLEQVREQPRSIRSVTFHPSTQGGVPLRRWDEGERGIPRVGSDPFGV
jgi:hypothetical protein